MRESIHAESEEFIFYSIFYRFIERKKDACTTLEADMKFPFVRKISEESQSKVRKLHRECLFCYENTAEGVWSNSLFIVEKEFIKERARNDLELVKITFSSFHIWYEDAIFCKEKVLFEKRNSCFEDCGVGSNDYLESIWVESRNLYMFYMFLKVCEIFFDLFNIDRKYKCPVRMFECFICEIDVHSIALRRDDDSRRTDPKI